MLLDHHQSPWSRMASATLMKPAMLAPATSEGIAPPSEYLDPVSQQVLSAEQVSECSCRY
jgi:hypothetical protein